METGDGGGECQLHERDKWKRNWMEGWMGGEGRMPSNLIGYNCQLYKSSVNAVTCRPWRKALLIPHSYSRSLILILVKYVFEFWTQAMQKNSFQGQVCLFMGGYQRHVIQSTFQCW